MTPKEFGLLIFANASTIRDWGKGEHTPAKRKQQKIGIILNKEQQWVINKNLAYRESNKLR